MATRSQRYAQHVYTQLAAIQTRDRHWIKEYGRCCNRFPALVLANGLAQTLGFLSAKAGDDSNSAAFLFLSHLAEILDIPPERTVERVIAAELATYQRYTRHALAAAVWYKRFAVSVLDVELTD